MAESTVETHEFQAEVKQLLDIVINSLYTDKEIFIRELVSNAADSLEKLRHHQLQGAAVHDDNLPLEINISTDDTAKTITIQDFGIGMTHDELVENLGTIAHSGSKAFLQALKEQGGGNENLIGQFGVGFYSAFMAGQDVKVYTRSYQPEGEGWLWHSEGAGRYEIEPAKGQRRGAKIVISLKDDAQEFASESRVKDILERYSAFIDFPINLNGEKVNTKPATWLKAKSDVDEEEYQDFYKYQAKAFDEPFDWMHFNADAPLVINALVYVPGHNPEMPGLGRIDPGVALHCRKVLIDPSPEKLLPEWLRFLKGVVDSADLPLNISRESMQDSALVQKLGTVITKRFLKHLSEIAKKDAEKYQKFFAEFGIFIKEGVATDFQHREQLAPLLRFESSMLDAGKLTSLPEYIDRMPQGQDSIYYLVGSSRKQLENSPYLEAFKARSLEVLFCTEEPIDEYVMTHLGSFQEKKLVSADSEVDLPESTIEAEGEPLDDQAVADLGCFFKASIGEDKIKEVKAGKRLTESPLIALNSDQMMTPSMRRMMQAMGQSEGLGAPLVSLELNPRHPLIKNLAEAKDTEPETAKLVAHQLYDNALLAAGLLDDPREMVTRLNDLMTKVTAK